MNLIRTPLSRSFSPYYRRGNLMNAQFPGDRPEVTIEKLRRLASDLARIRAGRGPTAAEIEGGPMLDGWAICVRPVSALIGMVRGHPTLRAHNRIVTSELFSIDPSRGWARTYSRFYELGTMSDGCEGDTHG
jgi:hypothetical protein